MARLTSICVSLFIVLGNVRIAVAQHVAYQERVRPSPVSAFRYAIIRNQTIDGKRYPEGGPIRLRGVDILMDANSFSEANLRQLVQLLVRRFPDPENLVVNIYTNLEDVPTPEEADFVPPPDSKVVGLTELKSAWAFYIRNRDGEHFDYDTKEPGVGVRTVTLRGKKQ